MINRNNWNDIRAYLQYKIETTRRSPATIKSNWGHLIHLLAWADDKALERAVTIKPTLPAYMEGLSHDERRLSAAYLASFFKTARHFMRWVRREYPTRYKKLTETWLDTLRPSRERSELAVLKVRQIYTAEEVVQIAQAGMRHEELTLKRVGAAAAMMFISGMRIGAFLTLPIECVDLEHNQVLQLPEFGVATKNRKAARTTLLQIPELIDVVTKWDELVRAKLPGSAYWFAHLDRDAEISQDKPSQANRTTANPNFRKALLKLCAETGVEYKSAHKLRHGFAVWAIKHASSMEQMKAISQNLMHSNMGITDGIYGKLVDDDVQRAILGLGKKAESQGQGNLGLEGEVERILRKLMKEKEA